MNYQAPEELAQETLNSAEGDIQAAVYALEDGAYLKSLDITDQSLVEEAHCILSGSL